MSDLEPRIAVLEQIARDTLRGLDRMDQRLDRMDQRLDRIEERQHADFRFLIRLQITLFLFTMTGQAAILGVAAHGFHWI